MTINYLSCDIYRPGYGDCSNRGVSHFFQNAAVVLPDGHGNMSFDPEEKTLMNLCMLVRRDIRGVGSVLTVYPACVENGRVVKRPGWWMNGGCFVDGDSRFSEACADLLGNYFCGAVQLHDRCEERRRR